MFIETQRLMISPLEPAMAPRIHSLSLDEDIRRFVPDEVFETVEAAAETLDFLCSCYKNGSGPQVYAVSLKEGTLIGYVQAVPGENGEWEIGYHIGKSYTKKGYAAEAVQAFLPEMMKKLSISEIKGISLSENAASIRVLEKCGFKKQYEGMGLYQGSKREICIFSWVQPLP